MRFSSYDELIKNILSQPSEKAKLNTIIKYFIDNVEYDYVMIEHVNEIVTPRFAKYADLLFSGTSSDLRQKAINFMRNSSNISNQYWIRLREIYLTPQIDKHGNLKSVSMLEALNLMSPDVVEINGLLIKGTSEHICTFAKKLCDEVGIQSLIVKGVSSGRMTHNWLDIKLDEEELFYDISYALYVRDNFCRIASRYTIEDWLGMSPKQLYKNQCTRNIISPSGFNLKNLWLNNYPLNMINAQH
ncbi:MAG: hypothetical protein IJA72_02970 [Clostridia bacterium]|nr:hypothetical protein [Clostridia bacterium]